VLVKRGNLILIVVLASPLAGCTSAERAVEELVHARVDISSDDLDAAPPPPSTDSLRVDLVVRDYEARTAPFLDAIVSGIENDTAFSVAHVDYKGEWASRGIARRQVVASAPAVARLEIECVPDGSASVANGFIAFPGMLPFLPIWLGYGWDMNLAVRWTLERAGERDVPGERTVKVAFRERNARRSAIFHLWPSTGFLGVQFVMGLVLAPTFWSYDDEATTPLLAETIGPRLGWTISSAVRRSLPAAQILARRDDSR
jgi:hypothetical protein